jgi:hypothetical protein
MGACLIISSAEGIVRNAAGYEAIKGIYVLSFVLGVIQFIFSLHYQKVYKEKILIVCFGLEGIYYIIATVSLWILENELGIKIFGSVIGVGLLTLTVTSLISLYKNVNSL